MKDNIKEPSTMNHQPTTKVLVFDNYDSFTYNLVQIVEQILGEKVDVFRNDEIPLEDINQYDKIILSHFPLWDIFYRSHPVKYSNHFSCGSCSGR